MLSQYEKAPAEAGAFVSFKQSAHQGKNGQTIGITIRETMKEIPAHFSVCLDLYFFYGMAYNEISIITDLPVNTVKSHIFRAKKLMKQKLEEKI